MGEKRKAGRASVGKSEGKRPLGRRRWENNTKMGLLDIEWCGTGWINLAQDRNQWRTFVNNEPSGSIKCW
jgi:hypothetical protein